jgi:hypothetical protein
MLRLVIVASLLLAGCRMSLEGDDTVARTCSASTTLASCLEAEQTMHADLAWIESKIFVASCNFSGCHGSATDLGKLDLGAGKSHDALVGVPSRLDPTRTLVVPNDVNASFLMLMLRDISPDMATPPGSDPVNGFMPKDLPTLCCQKLEAIERWIMAGAPNL